MEGLPIKSIMLHLGAILNVQFVGFFTINIYAWYTFIIIIN